MADYGFLYLREDYGATWEGNINIKNCIYKQAPSARFCNIRITYDNGKEHDYGYKLYLPNIYIDGLKIEDENIVDYDILSIFGNIKNSTNKENGELRDNYILPKNIIIKNYQTTTGRRLNLFYNKFYNNLDEIGINLSMPLTDKKEVKITNNSGEELKDNAIVKDDIVISKEDVEGIQTIVKINNEDMEGNKKILKDEGVYEISIIYQNVEGEKETVTKRVTITQKPVSEEYQVEEDIIKNVKPNTTKEIVLSKFLNNEKYEITRDNTTLNNNEIVATGDKLQSENGKEYALVITGDIKEDGIVNISDLVRIRKYLLGIRELSNIEKLAADANLDNQDISIKDLVRIRKILLNGG